MKETQVHPWIRERLPRDCHVVRMETHMSPGVPDLNICWRGREYWMELKVSKENLDNGRIPLIVREAQVAWIRRGVACGRTIFLVVAVEMHKEPIRVFFMNAKVYDSEPWMTRDQLHASSLFSQVWSDKSTLANLLDKGIKPWDHA
jgi:hypothetical protein